MPSQAVEEPLELVVAIMDERAYARARERVDRAEKAEDIPDDALSELVVTIEAEIAQEAKEKRRRGNS